MYEERNMRMISASQKYYEKEKDADIDEKKLHEK